MALTARRGELVNACQRSDPRSIVQRIARLFMRFPSTRLPDGTAETTMAAYAADLASFPMWAIEEACLVFIKGQGEGSKAFAPSSAELRIMCERAMWPVRHELNDITNVLNAEVYSEPTPEVRAKILAEFRELVDELKLNVDPRDKSPAKSRPLTKDEAQAALDRIDATQPLPKLSEATLGKLGIRPAPEPSAEAAE